MKNSTAQYHVAVDRKTKRIKVYSVTDASVHDRQQMVEMIGEDDCILYADSAYVGAE